MNKELRKLVIKTFHIEKIMFAEKTYIKNNVLFLKENLENQAVENEDIIKSVHIKIIEPNDKEVWVNSIMDFYPIATKVQGRLGEGVTNLITGVVVMLTGVDELGIPQGKFGWSSGYLKDIVYFNRRGTPSTTDIILNIDVILKTGRGSSRPDITTVHRVCDKIVQEIRHYLKNVDSSLCDEVHEFVDKVKAEKKKVIILKQVAAQGVMYNNQLFPKEPCGVIGSKSIIDCGSLPMVLSPNEYRDGALRAMT
ncbi:proline reductase cluster protein PrdD [Clostridium sp. JS66]|uniref:proline reductase cluster protein PrdD n=1 Tax=Clostridium sp. JS66 TaxID=3064705 RepID=UPI00298DE65F|nr:proline reductase cluster protein PrdD [Clostridium sp. JS66]WPC40489.1 proline reductase cluster protein PrdD [Clostridium sp. JS66]